MASYCRARRAKKFFGVNVCFEGEWDLITSFFSFSLIFLAFLIFFLIFLLFGPSYDGSVAS